MPKPLSPETNTSAVDSASPARPAPARRRWQRVVVPAGGGVLAVIIVSAGAFAGWWFLPFVAGLAIGVIGRHCRRRWVLTGAVGVAAAGWAIPLVLQAARGAPVVATARAVAALAGLPASGWLMLGITLLVAAVQALAGVWLARAIWP